MQNSTEPTRLARLGLWPCGKATVSNARVQSSAAGQLPGSAVGARRAAKEHGRVVR
jgi:hypothetical protein